MPFLAHLKSFVRNTFGRRGSDPELDAELASTVEMLAEQKVKEGMQPPEARRAARIELGGLEQVKEEVRQARSGAWLESLLHDARFGARLLRKSPGFTAVAVLTLALGIGANTAIFSVVDAVLLRPLPFPKADRLVMVWEDAAFMGFPENTPATANFVDWKKQNHVFSDMAAVTTPTFNLAGDGDPETVEGAAATWNLFPLLGEKPVLGRTFLPEEDRPGGAKVVLLSYGLWKRRFGGDPGVFGRYILVNNEKNLVIGVMPMGFHFPFKESEIWAPVGFSEAQWSRRGAHFLDVVARLKPGVTLAQARADMSVISARLAAEYPDYNSRVGSRVIPLREQYVGTARTGLLVLLAAVGCVLLIACANVANLLLARAMGRTREMAVRRALGAAGLRLARQLLTENLLLAALGGLLGVALANWSLSFLKQLVPTTFSTAVDIGLDTRVFAFTLLATLLTGLLAGLAPVVKVARLNVNEFLKEGSARAGFESRSWTRNFLVVAEVALTFVLLVCASLLLRSFANLRGLDPGFRSQGVLSLRVVLPRNKYPDAASRAAFFDRAMEKLRNLPGVNAAGFTSALPLVWKGGTSGFLVEGQAAPLPGLPYDANDRVVSPNYMQVMGMSLRSGRFFEEADGPQGQPVVIINETLASMYFPGQDALGKRIKFDDGDPKSPWLTIIGILNDVKAMGLDVPSRPETYYPYRQAFNNWMKPRDIVLRTSGDPLSLASAARQRIWEVDADQPVSNISTLDDILDEEVQNRRVQAMLLGAFSALALVLACVGLYGVLSFLVSRRTQEIGVRVAFGARPQDILAHVVGRGLALALVGIGIGLAAALVLTSLLASQLFGVGARDPLTFVAVPVILLVVASAASFFPARRAMRVDPMVALRYE